jgi:hypothetical protein
MMIQWRNWKLIWITPVVFGLVGGIEALIAGSVVGGVYVFRCPGFFWSSLRGFRANTTVYRIGGVYTAGYFGMSTWIPFSWGIINALVLILSSFAIQGGL